MSCCASALTRTKFPQGVSRLYCAPDAKWPANCGSARPGDQRHLNSMCRRPSANTCFKTLDHNGSPPRCLELFPLHFHIADVMRPRPRLCAQNCWRLLHDYDVRGKLTHDTNILATMLTHGIDTICSIDSDFERFSNRVTILRPRFTVPDLCRDHATIRNDPTGRSGCH